MALLSLPGRSSPFLRALAAVLVTCCIALGVVASLFRTVEFVNTGNDGEVVQAGSLKKAAGNTPAGARSVHWVLTAGQYAGEDARCRIVGTRALGMSDGVGDLR
ncbi:hypothetical protein ACIBJC_08295 [Streptomyces sp. NPDC050509]|uniref:hypothetical protein n=1 Tax=Streptomyces sp. NPDC050509 TaxID=3365620 RepID=UPI0037B5D456